MSRNMTPEMTQEQHNMLKYITEISFSLQDTVMFLDTHPCNQEALKYYKKLKMLRREAVNEYSKKYAPLLQDQVECENYWTWVETPWPWEF